MVKAPPKHHQTRLREPNAKRWRELPTTFTGAAPGCAITGSLVRCRSPVARSKARAKTLIKDRMERSGMRWTEQMAEANVQLRAIYLSGDFNDYWHFHIEQDQKRLYPECKRRGPSFQNSHTQLKWSKVVHKAVIRWLRRCSLDFRCIRQALSPAMCWRR